jgi:hypothetical protein
MRDSLCVSPFLSYTVWEPLSKSHFWVFNVWLKISMWLPNVQSALCIISMRLPIYQSSMLRISVKFLISQSTMCEILYHTHRLCLLWPWISIRSLTYSLQLARISMKLLISQSAVCENLYVISDCAISAITSVAHETTDGAHIKQGSLRGKVALVNWCRHFVTVVRPADLFPRAANEPASSWDVSGVAAAKLGFDVGDASQWGDGNTISNNQQ